MSGPPSLRDRLPTWAPAALVLVVAAAGMARVATSNWREGASLLGGALLIAAALRILLPEDRVGLLAVRSRAVDVLLCLFLGTALVVLAVTITRDPLSFG